MFDLKYYVPELQYIRSADAPAVTDWLLISGEHIRSLSDVITVMWTNPDADRVSSHV